MKKMRFGISILACLLLASNTFAGLKMKHHPPGLDPVHPTLLYGLPAQSTVGNSYVAAYRINNNLPKAVPLTISLKFHGSAFSVSSGCDKTLAPKGQSNDSCLLYIQYRPHSAGVKSPEITMNYWNDVVPIIPALYSTASGQSTTNPIKGYVTVALPPITYANITYPVTFTYINTGPTAVTATAPVAVTGNGQSFFTQLTNTCNAPIPAYIGQCFITGTFTPTGSFPASGTAVSLNTTYTYVFNGASTSVPLSTTTIAQNNSGCHQVEGVAELPLPAQTYIYADNVVKYVFTNYCTPSETLGIVQITSNFPVTTTITRGEDGCSNHTLAQGQHCSVYASIIPNSLTSSSTELNVKASVAYNSNASTATTNTSESVVTPSNQATIHTVQFVNQCNYDVWYEFSNNPSGGAPDPTIASGQNTYSGTLLLQQLPTVPPVPTTVPVISYLNGALYARTGCDTSGTCTTGGCPVISGTMSCQVGIQPTPPQTKFELNMNTVGNYDGIYDVSLVNGFNVPGQVQSMAARSSALPPAGNSPYPFNCGQSAGAIIQPQATGLGACPWTFTPPTTSPDQPYYYTWVEPGAGDGCTSSASCSGGEQCGMAFTSQTLNQMNTPINSRCGGLLGYWTLADFAGYPSNSDWGTVNLYTTYLMGNTLQPAGTLTTPIQYGNVAGIAATYADMFECKPTSTNSLMSGYTLLTAPPPVPSALVCGCPDWTGLTAVEAPGCQQNNATATDNWQTIVYPHITWLKNACPTAYSFEFDDKSSSFSCNPTRVQTSYQVTFCPGGKTGLS